MSSPPCWYRLLMKIKMIQHAAMKDPPTISTNYGMIGTGTCPKFWKNRPQQQKILRINFHNFDYSCLPTSNIKEIKTIDPATKKFFLIIPSNFDVRLKLTSSKTWGKAPEWSNWRKNHQFLALLLTLSNHRDKKTTKHEPEMKI